MTKTNTAYDLYLDEMQRAMRMRETFVPPHMRGPLMLWITKAIEPGSFGMAVIRNDLVNALLKADSINRQHLVTIVTWMIDYAPSQCWMDEESIKSWKGYDAR